MSSYIFGKMSNRNAFELNWDFKLNGKRIDLYAIWDTGCSKTMLSYNTIIKRETLNEYERENYKIDAIKSQRAKLSIGYGVESQSKEYMEYGAEVGCLVYKYNNEPNSLTKEEFDRLVEFKGLKFAYKITNVRIAGYKCRDYIVEISYDYDNVALIGMEIIKDFYSIICSKGNNTFLFAKFKYIDGLEQIYEEANLILDELPDDEEYIDFLNTQDKHIDSKTKKKTLTKEDFQANYVNSLIKKEK